MKTVLASLAALAAVSTSAFAGGHGHHHYGYSHYNYVRYAPVYVEPVYSCKIIYHHGHAHRTCFKVDSYGH